MAQVISVGPGVQGASHEIKLKVAGRHPVGLRVKPGDISVVPVTPSTLNTSGGGTKFGDFEPAMSHIEQSDWSGGRGQDRFVDDPSRFFDSQNCWTLTPGRLLPGGMWFMQSVRTSIVALPGAFSNTMNVVWSPLLGTTRYRAHKFTPASTVTADKAYVWIRRVGSPGTLTVEIQTDTAGAPSGSVSKSQTATVSTVTDYVSVLQVFDWTTTTSLTSGTPYHIVIYGASTDNAANHWEVATNGSNSTNGNYSTAGSSWTNNTPAIHYWIVPADVDRKLIFFELDGAVYAVSNDAAGGAPTLYLCGYRGKATAATTTTLTDSNQAFTANSTSWTPTQSSVTIINGTGSGQTRRISSATATVLTVTPAFSKTPDTTSEYVVVGNQDWSVIAGHGLTVPVTSVCVTGNLPGTAYFAQGTTTMRRMDFDAALATPAHEFADDVTTDVDLLYTFYDSASKAVQVWGAVNGANTASIMRAPALAWGTNLTFGTAIPVGNSQFKITNLIDHGGVLYVVKEDSLWRIVNDVPERVNVGLDSSPSSTNGQAAASLNKFLYFNFMHSTERLYGETLDDMGDKNIPVGRTGPVSAMTTAFGWLFYAVDGGTSGTSSVFCWDGLGRHEIFRAWEAGQRVRSLHWQAIPGAFPRLYADVGGNVVLIQFPLDTLNPLSDSSFNYQHEGVLITSTIDMGATTLPKFFKELTLITKGLATGIEVRVDYQVDTDIGSSTWYPLAVDYMSPVEVLPVALANKRQIRLRLRLITNSSTTPAEVRATVLEGFARTPLKYQYNILWNERPEQQDKLGTPDISPDDLFSFLQELAVSATPVFVRSRLRFMDKKWMLVEPASIRVKRINDDNKSWGGQIAVTLREI